MQWLDMEGAAKNENHFLLRLTQGFTLTEVLVVLAIMMVLIVATLTSFSSYADRRTFERYVNEVTLSISEQRQSTLASVDDEQYGIYVGTSTIEYFQGPSYVSATAVTGTQELPNTMSATSSLSGGSWDIVFERLTGAASATGTITLADTRSGKTATITINQLGLVE